MRRTKEEAAQTRQALLKAALSIFSEQGYQAARLQDIAEAAGTTRGAIYHHFKNKADLYRTLIDEASQQGDQIVQEAISAGGSASEILSRVLTDSLELISRDTHFRQVMALSLFKAGVSDELAELEIQRIQGAQASVDGIAAYMQFAIDNGEFRADIDAQAMARTFLALQNGAALLWLANGQFFPLHEDATAMADIMLHGVRTTGQG